MANKRKIRTKKASGLSKIIGGLKNFGKSGKRSKRMAQLFTISGNRNMSPLVGKSRKSTRRRR